MVTPGMPTAWIVAPGAAMRSAWAIDSGEPTQSTTASAPPPSWPLSYRIVPDRLRTARSSSPGATTTSAPSSAASARWCGCLAVAIRSTSGRTSRSAAMVSRPSVPLPMSATRPASTWAAACTAQAVGSTITAASSESSAGTATSWLSWATISVDQPPPVLSQKPHCRPGSRSPKPMRSQWLMRPSAHGRQTGRMPRATQLRTGTTTARCPSSRSPTTSWPGVNGNDTIGSNHRDDVPSIVARSEPQMPDRRGRSRTQPGPGQLGRIDVAQRERTDLGAAAGREPAGHHGGGELGRLAREHERLHRRPRCSDGVDLADAAAARAAPLRADREQGLRGALRLVEVLDEPAALAGEGGQARLGVHGHREADGLEHREVGGGVGVGDPLGQVEAVRRRRSRTAPTRAPRRWAGTSVSSPR